MTLTTTTTRIAYAGAGSTGPFAFPFKVLAAGDLAVYRDDTLLTLTADYSVAGVGDAAGGSVTLDEALAVGETLTIRRVVSVTQPSAFRDLSTYFPSSHEAAMDRLAMVDQQQQDQLDRSLRLAPTADPATYDTELPTPTAGKVLTGTGLGFTMSTLDSSAVALPGEGRTVATLSAFLTHNAVYNPEDYGAVLNGVTDDYAAHQAACDAAADAGGGVVRCRYSASGSALSHYVHVPPGVTYDGGYTEFIPLAGATLGEYGALFMVGSEHPNDTGAAEVTASANAHIRRVVYVGSFTGDPTGTDLLTEANYGGLCSNPIMLFNNVGGSAKECHITGAKNIGIGIHGSRNVEVTRNRIAVCLWQGVGGPQTRPADGAHVHHNYFEDIGTYAGDLHSVTVGNTFENNELVRCGQVAKSQTGPLTVRANVGSLDVRAWSSIYTAVLISTGSGSVVTDNRLTGVVTWLADGGTGTVCRDNDLTADPAVTDSARLAALDGTGFTFADNKFHGAILATRGLEIGVNNAATSGKVLDNTITCSLSADSRFPIYAPNVTGRLELRGNKVDVTSDGGGVVATAVCYLTGCSNVRVVDNQFDTQNPAASRPSLYMNDCTGVVHGNKGNSQRRIQGTGTVKHYANEFSAVHVSDTVTDWYEPLTGSGDPNGVVTSRRAGDLYIDTAAAPDKAYLATDAAATVWVALN